MGDGGRDSRLMVISDELRVVSGQYDQYSHSVVLLNINAP